MACRWANTEGLPQSNLTVPTSPAKAPFVRAGAFSLKTNPAPAIHAEGQGMGGGGLGSHFREVPSSQETQPGPCALFRRHRDVFSEGPHQRSPSRVTQDGGHWGKVIYY